MIFPYDSYEQIIKIIIALVFLLFNLSFSNIRPGHMITRAKLVIAWVSHMVTQPIWITKLRGKVAP